MTDSAAEKGKSGSLSVAPGSINQKEDKSFAVPDIVVPRSDHYLAIFTFIMIGSSQLLMWNMILNCLQSMSDFIWSGIVLSDLLGGCEHFAALLIAVLMLKFDGLNSKMCHMTGVLNVIMYLIFPMVPHFFGGEDNIVKAKVLLSVICVFLGFCAGLMHVYGYAFASVLPSNYVGYVSIGNGVAGVVSFFVYLTLFAIFPATAKGQVGLIWAFFAIGAVFSCIQVVCFHILSQKSWFRQCIALAKEKQVHDAEKALRDWGKRRSLLAILMDCWVQAFNASFTLLVTLLVFPVSGPHGWNQTPIVRETLVGVFQICDLLLRWMPLLGGWTKLSKKWLTILVLLRPLIFLPLFILPARIKQLPFLGSTLWLFVNMILFTITNGWFVTLGSVYCPETVKHPVEKKIASEIFVISVLACVTIGIFGSKLPVLK